MLDLNEVLVLSSDIVLRGIGNKYWALNTKRGNQYKLNEVSYSILDVFHKPLKINSMIESMLNEYKVDRARLEADCVAIIGFAIEKNILVKGV